MCTKPIKIPNPNFGLARNKIGKNVTLANGRKLFEYKDCTAKYIEVNCGECEECIKTKQMAIAQRIQMEGKNNHLFFSTMTYNEEMIPKYETSQGYSIKYAEWKDLQDVIKRLRKRNAFGRKFKYFAVSERGSEKARPHFHVIWIVEKEKGDEIYTPIQLEKTMRQELLNEWKRNVGSRRAPEYKNLCTYKRKILHGRIFSNYDLHYIVGSVGDDGATAVAFYVTKYMMKAGTHETNLHRALQLNYEESEAEKIWQTVKSRNKGSLYLGLNASIEKTGKGRWAQKVTYDKKTVEKLKRDVQNSTGFPMFFNTEGKSMPMSRYYKNKGEIYTLEEATRLRDENTENKVGKDLFIKNRHWGKGQWEKAIREYEKKVQRIVERGDIDNYGYLFDD